MKYRLFGIALAFVSLWALAGLSQFDYEIRSLPYELGLPVFFLSVTALGVCCVTGLAMVFGLIVSADDEA